MSLPQNTVLQILFIGVICTLATLLCGWIYFFFACRVHCMLLNVQALLQKKVCVLYKTRERTAWRSSTDKRREQKSKISKSRYISQHSTVPQITYSSNICSEPPRSEHSIPSLKPWCGSFTCSWRNTHKQDLTCVKVYIGRVQVRMGTGRWWERVSCSAHVSV